jgi:UDP-N-acetylglucosamine--N-acetylmuramyl-(pentapeptide) pyrophosphoryl-undecaprenol N-acetylglucosamine transferase
VIDIFKLPFSMLSAVFKMFWNMPDIVFSKGGYGSFSVVLAARFYRIPVFIHESDAKAGLANKKLARHAEKVFVGFALAREDFPKNEVVVSGNPIRAEITEGSPDKAKFVFHILRKNKPVILVSGGSQGASTINELILDNLEVLLHNFEVIHIVGAEKYDHVISEVKLRLGKIETTGYHPYPFLADEMSLAYALADVVISRAGGGSIFEIAANRKPCILIPLEGSAQDHQRINAYEYAGAGAAVILEEFNLTPTILLASLEKLLLPEVRKKMAQAAGNFIKVNAASVIAQELINRVYKS